MEAEHWKARGFGEMGCKSSSFKAGVHGVASLRVGALKVEQVTGLEAHAGAAQSNAGGSESTQPGGRFGAREQVAHAESSLSG
jgi:hypothetical protein